MEDFLGTYTMVGCRERRRRKGEGEPFATASLIIKFSFSIPTYILKKSSSWDGRTWPTVNTTRALSCSWLSHARGRVMLPPKICSNWFN